MKSSWQLIPSRSCLNELCRVYNSAEVKKKKVRIIAYFCLFCYLGCRQDYLLGGEKRKIRVFLELIEMQYFLIAPFPIDMLVTLEWFYFSVSHS